MIPMNNPLLAALEAARRGQDPLQMLNTLTGQDPRMGRAMQMLRGKNANQLEHMARNMARERGIDLNELIRSLNL